MARNPEPAPRLRGNGYMSSFQSSKLGLAASAASMAGNLLGGIFGRAADTAHEIQRMVGGPAHVGLVVKEFWILPGHPS